MSEVSKQDEEAIRKSFEANVEAGLEALMKLGDTGLGAFGGSQLDRGNFVTLARLSDAERLAVCTLTEFKAWTTGDSDHDADEQKARKGVVKSFNTVIPWRDPEGPHAKAFAASHGR